MDFIMSGKTGVKVALVLLLAFLTSLTASATLTITRNMIGEYGDFGFEFWRQSEGEGSMVVNRDGTFDCSWENADVILFRTGIKMGSPGGIRTSNVFTHEELGDIYIDYAADYNPDGNSYLCVYGWTLNPLVEYYIIEAWGTWHPAGDEHMGVIEVDGCTYDIYVTTRVEEPSINGTQTFAQFWSVRTEMRTEGTISVSEHFKAWEKAGMELGKMFEVSFCVEGIYSSGEASVYRHGLKIGENTYGDVSKMVISAPDSPALDPFTIAIVSFVVIMLGTVTAAIVVNTRKS
jgi:endo-1,4-beta-xylanase